MGYIMFGALYRVMSAVQCLVACCKTFAVVLCNVRFASDGILTFCITIYKTICLLRYFSHACAVVQTLFAARDRRAI